MSMKNNLTRWELDRLGLSADPETGKIFLDGVEIEPVVFRGRRGLTYPKISVYDPLVYRRTKKQGGRNILAGRIVWAYANGCAPGDMIIKAKNRDPFDLRLENLEAVPRRGPRK